MSTNDFFKFIVNISLILPVIFYLIYVVYLLYLQDGTRLSSNDLMGKEKLIKEFKQRFLQQPVADDDLQARELLAQRITNNSNISGRFVAYCIKREINNLNYISYLFTGAKKIIVIPDVNGNKSLQCNTLPPCIFFKGVILPGLLAIAAYCKNYYFDDVNTTYTILVIHLALFLIALFFLYVCCIPNLCALILTKHLEVVFYKQKNFKQDKICYCIGGICKKFILQWAPFMSVTKKLEVLENKQMFHDERYHKDIWLSLSTQGKARHMAAHIGKYSGQLLDNIRNQSDEKIRKDIIDSLIINLSFSNIFISLLSKTLDESLLKSESFGALRDAVAKKYFSEKGYVYPSETLGLDLAMDMCILSGKILKTVESLDHIEILNYRERFNGYTLDLFEIIMSMCYVYQIVEIENLIEKRLYEVELKNPRFGVFGNYKDGYK